MPPYFGRGFCRRYPGFAQEYPWGRRYPYMERPDLEPVYPEEYRISKEQEIEMLESETKEIEEEKKELANELNEIKKRIDELKSKEKTE